MKYRTLSIALLLGALLVAPASAQLSGNYTVDNTVATGGTNYNTLADAATALIAQGVSGPVVFSINTGSGAYAGFAIGAPITGSSATNTVTFQPGVAQTPLLNAVAAGTTQVIKLGTATTVASGPSNIIISGLTITGATTGAGIMVAGCNNITIQGCTVFGTPGQTGSGIYLCGTTNSAVRQCEVYSVGMTPGTPGSATYSGGIGVYLSSSACTIARNKVHDCVGCGIHIGTSGSATAVTNCTVINNFVWNCPGTGTYTVAGISTRRTGGLVLSNNSVLMAGANAGIYMSATDGGASAEVSNNIVRHTGTGPCFRFEAAGTLAATVFNYNLYDVGPSAFVGGVAAVNYATLAAWTAVAPVIGKEANSLVGNAAFVSATDLHILPASAGFANGSAVAAVTDDIDGTPRANPPSRGAHEVQGVGIFANFSATPAAGAAALNVTFTDLTFTSDPGGVTSWAWDFQNDGITDSTSSNPSFVYLTPGTYSVKLTVTDVLNGSSNLVKTNYISVGPYVFDAQTTPGLGDLTIYPVPGIGSPNAVEGYMFVSFTIPAAVGTGPFFGLLPDSFTWSIAATPASVGNLLHWVLTPGIFPNTPLILPGGTLISLVGSTADFIQIDLTSSFTIANISNVDRITF